MMGLFNTDERPFDDVYIHGTVLDKRSAKMSKSKGNNIDPLIMIEGGTQNYLARIMKVRATVLMRALHRWT